MFYNETGWLGQVIMYSAYNVTGSLFLSLLLIFLILLTFCIAFKLPIELTLPVMLPLMIIQMAYMGEFVAIGGVMLIISAIFFVKFFILR
jgi:hypothetical protein